MNETIAVAISVVFGYLVGSIPFGLIIVKLAGLGDIREIGSKNIGATNVLRTGRKDLAFLTLVFDLSKAAVVSLIASYFFKSEVASLSAGFFAVIGHNFPVWLKFKGGKGVAATLGMILANSFTVGLLSSGTWLLTAAIFRISSLSALVALGLAPVYALIFENKTKAVFYFVIAVIAFIRHKENIKRIIKGEESKIKIKKDDKANG